MLKNLISRLWLIMVLVSLSPLHYLVAQNNDFEVVNKSYFGKDLLSILKDLSVSHELALDYRREEIPINILQRKNFKGQSLKEVLQDLLEPYDLVFHLEDKKLTIRTKEEGIQLEREPPKPKRTNFTLEGVVKDKETGETLPNAVVMINSTQKAAISNLDGFFTLLNVPTDTSLLSFRYLGYKSQELRLNPTMVEKPPLIVEMEVHTNELEEVVISAREEQMMKVGKQVSVVSVSPAQLSALPSLGEKDIFRSLQLLPGISGSNETSSGLYVRGGTPDQNLILFDGFTVYHVDHFYGFFSAFNADAIKDVQVYKGGFESKYGGRLSSVVDLTGKQGNTNKTGFSAGLSMMSANASFELPFAGGKGSVLLAGRRSYTDIIQSGLYKNVFALFQQEDETNGGFMGRGGRGGRGQFAQVETEPVFFFYDLNAKVTYKPSLKDILSFSFYNGQDHLDNSNEFNDEFGGGQNGNLSGTILNKTTDLTAWGNWGSSLKWGRQWNSRYYSNTVVSWSNYFSQRDLFSESEINRDDSLQTFIRGTQEDNDLYDFSFRTDHEFLLNSAHRLEFGTQWTFNKIDYNLTMNDTLQILNRNDEGLIGSLYIQDNWQIIDKLLFTPGIRLSNYSLTKQLYFEPRLSAIYELTKQLKFKAAWGHYYQFANRVVREDVSEGSRDFWLLANDDTNPVSQAVHYIAGLSYETAGFLFDIEAYRKDMSGLSEYSLRFSRPGSGETGDLFYTGTGIAQGIEFLVQRKIGKLTGWISYTLGEVIHTFPELSDEPYPALHDQTHEFKIVNSLQLGRWTFAGTWIYATGKPYTAPVGGYELTMLDGNQISYISIGEKNAFRLPDYHRLDLSATYGFNLGKGKADVGLSVFNVYNHQNVWYKTFEVLEEDVITTDVNTIGFTPNIFLQVKF
ncbi:TonB-dependent receptor [Xanthovirga aplysinae]|uniref:TonB-dependent receptor n=1 Tax=Xanthovirga aplysinae TaxID=2529853 RepID=UPI0012BD5C9F|nr:TonB-dependent receptor [Xanthovirga aplysinae]MTI30875.1 TonB-dependent receptor [Xanthovirga aplysinae]